MKKSRNRRRRTAKLTTKDISKCQYFMNIGKKMNAHKVELKFLRANKTIGSVAFIEDAPHKQTVDGMIIATMHFDLELKRLSHSI